MHSVLWHCWLGIRKSIWLIKNWVMRCWCGYLSGVRCKWFAYGPGDDNGTLASVKSRMVLSFWCRLTQVVPLNECPSLSVLLSGSVLVTINEAPLCQARSVLGWLIIFRQANHHLSMRLMTQANSACPLLCGSTWWVMVISATAVEETASSAWE